MQGWAKGLKDRVERTATQLSTQATTAFTPPDEDSEGSDPTARRTSNGTAVAGDDPTNQAASGETSDVAGGGEICLRSCFSLRCLRLCTSVIVPFTDGGFGIGIALKLYAKRGNAVARTFFTARLFRIVSDRMHPASLIMNCFPYSCTICTRVRFRKEVVQVALGDGGAKARKPCV